MKNAAVIQLIIDNSPADFKAAVGDIGETNFATWVNGVLGNPNLLNEFIFNTQKVGLQLIKGDEWQNPLAPIKGGRVNFGSIIEESIVDLVPQEDYNPEDMRSDVLKRYLPSTNTFYHVRNRKARFAITTSREEVRDAFFTEGGMMRLISKIQSRLTTSDNYTEYLYMRNILQAFSTEGLFYPVVVPDYTTKDNIASILQSIKSVSNNMTFMKRQYNASNVARATPKTDQILFVSSDFDAAMDVNFYAQIFNMDPAQIQARKIVVDEFGFDGAVAILASRDWMVAHDTEYHMQSFQNAGNLEQNNFLHHWGIYSASQLENAVLFTTTTPTLTGITVNPSTATIDAGTTQQFQVVRDSGDTAPIKCTWTTNATNPGTFITSTGLLYVHPDETTTPITVTATSTFDTGISATATVTVS